MVKKLDTIEFNQETELLKSDWIAEEVPLEISTHWEGEDHRCFVPLSTTLCSPTDCEDLVYGFLFAEKIIAQAKDIVKIVLTPSKEKENIKALVTLSNHVKKQNVQALKKNFISNSSCGACGKSSLDLLKVEPHHQLLRTANIVLNEHHILSAPKKMRLRQNLFQLTGGVHCATYFNAHGEIEDLFEDIGRHNALDKLIGHRLKKGEDFSPNEFVLFSGRLGYELVQKSIRAGIHNLVSIGPPSSLAVSLAQKYSLNIMGFLKENRFNFYSRSKGFRVERNPSSSPRSEDLPPI